MKLYNTILQTGRLIVKVKAGQKEKDGKSADLVQRYRSKTGSESLIYAPNISIQFTLFKEFGSREVETITFDIGMIPIISTKIADVYKAVVSDNCPVYAKDENGLFTIDRERAIKNYGRKISAYDRFLEIYPGVYTNDNVSEKCITLQVENTAVPLNLVKARDLINVLDRVDIMSYSMLLGITDQLATVIDTTDKINKKLDAALGKTKTPTQAAKSSSAEWVPAPDSFSDIY